MDRNEIRGTHSPAFDDGGSERDRIAPAGQCDGHSRAGGDVLRERAVDRADELAIVHCAAAPVSRR